MMQLPSNKQIKDVLEGMLGRQVTLEPSRAKLSPVDAVGALIVTYVDDTETMAAILGWSIDAAAYVGCSLSLVPMKMAKEMAKDRELRLDVVEGLSEVSNVLAAALNQPGNPHTRMAQSYFPTSTAPDEVSTYMFSHSNRIDLDLTVEGYGQGQLTLVACG